MTNAGVSFSPKMVEIYASLTGRRPTSQRDLNALGALATDLAKEAFVAKDPDAWNVVQAAQWMIYERSNLRPFSPTDAVVLEAMYEVEESTLPWIEVEEGLSPTDFCKLLASKVGEHSSEEGQLALAIESGVLGDEEWHYLGYQWLPLAIDFTRQIALASLPLPRRQARILYENLYDEVGRGDFARAHFPLLARFLEPFGVRPEDRRAITAWAAPEVIALANAQNRILWHAEPGWGLGSLFLSERLVPSELSRVRSAVSKMKLADGASAFFDEHVVLDVAHSEEWLGIISELIEKPSDQAIALNAAVQRGHAQRAAWDGAFQGLMTLKQTGVAPHVPVTELEDAVAGLSR